MFTVRRDVGCYGNGSWSVTNEKRVIVASFTLEHEARTACRQMNQEQREFEMEDLECIHERELAVSGYRGE